MSRATGLGAFRALADSGLGVVDVGARDGSQPFWNEVAPVVSFTGFEPDHEECRRLNAGAGTSRFRSTKYLPYALGRETADATLHQTRSAGASSVYQPDSQFVSRFPAAERFDIVAQHAIQVRPLDELRAELPATVDFLKLDVQGGELDVLAGGARTLDEVVGVESEVEFAPIYRGQPVFRDVDHFLSERGFVLFKLRRLHWVRRGEVPPWRSAGQLVFGDALYLRDPLARADSAISSDGQKLEALVLIAAMYDLHDFALEIVDAPIAAAMRDVPGIRAYLVERSRRGRLAGLWKRRADRLALGEWLRGYSRSWARGDRDLYTRL